MQSPSTVVFLHQRRKHFLLSSRPHRIQITTCRRALPHAQRARYGSADVPLLPRRVVTMVERSRQQVAREPDALLQPQLAPTLTRDAGLSSRTASRGMRQLQRRGRALAVAERGVLLAIAATVSTSTTGGDFSVPVPVAVTAMRAAKEVFTENLMCTENNCVNPIFPAFTC